MDPDGDQREGDLEEDSYKILSQFYKERKDLLYHTADGVVACRRKDEEKIIHKHNLIILPQLYQTKVLFRSNDQMGHQGIDKVQQRIIHNNNNHNNNNNMNLAYARGFPHSFSYVS